MARKQAAVLGVPDLPLGRAFLCLLHPEETPSAALYRGDNEEIVYHDFHCAGEVTEYLTLPELRASLGCGTPTKLLRTQLSVWRTRLLVEAGLLTPQSIELRPLPADASAHLRRVYEGVELFFRCRWLLEPGVEAPFTRRFAVGWCGVREAEAKDANPSAAASRGSRQGRRARKWLRPPHGSVSAADAREEQGARSPNARRRARVSAAPVTVVLPGLTLIISPELVPRLESALRECRRAPERDLIGEITAFLAEHPGSSVVEIARALRARDQEVRRTLLCERRFQRLSVGQGRSPRASLWGLAPEAAELVPGAGTSAASEGTEAASGSRRSQLLQGHEEAEPLDG